MTDRHEHALVKYALVEVDPSHLAAVEAVEMDAKDRHVLAAGLSNQQIAEALHLSVRTVEKHVERLIMKTGRSRSELARTAQTANVPPAICTPLRNGRAVLRLAT